MTQLLKKEKIMVVIGEYTDRQTGQPKKQRRQIGERLTFRSDDGSTFAKGRLYGPHGCTDVDFYEDDQSQAQAPQPVQQPVQQPAGGFEDDCPF